VTRRSHPSFGEALRFWLKLGFISFGGPAGQIAIMHRELVERRRWISEARFLHALNYCMRRQAKTAPASNCSRNSPIGSTSTAPSLSRWEPW